MENDIQMWVLVMTLIFPRLGLLIAWFSGQIPHNDIPFVGDAILAILLPRLLMVIYIATNLGTGNGWFWAHLVCFVLATLINWARAHKMMEEGKNPLDPQSWMPEMPR